MRAKPPATRSLSAPSDKRVGDMRKENGPPEVQRERCAGGITCTYDSACAYAGPMAARTRRWSLDCAQSKICQ